MTHRFPSAVWQTVEEFIQSRDSRRIPPSLRLILTSDGLLTTALQSLFLAPVEVEVLRQEKAKLDDAAAAFLRLEPGIPSHIREVWLKCEGKRMVYARSVIPLDGFPPSLLLALAEKPIPLGLLLQEAGRPTFKDRMEVRRMEGTTLPGLPDPSFFRDHAPLWSRRYRLNHGDKNGVFIEEIFSELSFRKIDGRGGVE